MSDARHVRRPLLTQTVVHGDGRTSRSLRVFCGRLGRSMALDECSRCAAFLAVESDDDARGHVRCRAEGPGPNADDLRVPDAGFRAGAHASSAPLCVREEVTPLAVRALFRAHHPPFVVVVGDDGHVVGLVTEEAVAHLAPGAKTLRELMTSAGAANEALSIDAALVEMALSHRRSLVVVDASGTPVGSLRDVDALHAWTKRRRSERPTVASVLRDLSDMDTPKSDAPPGMARIKDVMTRAPHTIGTDQTFERAHAIMREHTLRHLPVLRAGKLVGVVSERDLYFVEALDGVDAKVDVVADAMSADVFTVTPEESIEGTVHAMAQHRYGCAVVVDRGRVVGIFTTTDALELLAKTV